MSFLRCDDFPIITVIISYAENPDEMIESIDLGVSEGAEAFCLQLERMPRVFRTLENFKNIFSHCNGKPIYASCYRWNNPEENQTDDEIVEDLLFALEAGADIIDIPSDLFDKSPNEVSYHLKAINKQKELINRIHLMGKQVIMSSHTRCRYSTGECLKLLRSQKDRGADIVKVVGEANNDDELAEAFLTDCVINKEIKYPHLYLVGGSNIYLHRRIGPFLGSCIFLCTINEKDTFQPKIKDALNLKRMMNNNK